MSEEGRTCPEISKTNTKIKAFETLFDYCLKIFVIVSTFFYLPIAPNADLFKIQEWGYMTQELFFRYGIVFLFALSIFMRPRRELISKTLGALLVYLIFSGIFITFDLQYRRAVLNLFLGLIFYKLVAERIDLDSLKKYSFWIFSLIYANFVLCIFQLFDKDPIFSMTNRSMFPSFEICGFMKLKATLGGLAAVTAPFLTLISPWGWIIAAPLIYFSKASSAALAFVLSMGFILYFRVKRAIFWAASSLLALAGGVYIVFYDLPTGQFNQRLIIWHRTISEVLRNSPFFGFGMGKFAAWQPQTAQLTHKDLLTWIWAHNEFVQLLFEGGLIALIFILIFFRQRIIDFRRFYMNRDLQVLFASVISISIISFFNFPFHIARMSGICIFLIAAYHAKVIELEKFHEH